MKDKAVKTKGKQADIYMNEMGLCHMAPFWKDVGEEGNHFLTQSYNPTFIITAWTTQRAA